MFNLNIRTFTHFSILRNRLPHLLTPFKYSLLLLILGLGFTVAAEVTPAEILRRADEHRGIQDRSFSLMIKINTFIKGEPREQLELISYVDTAGNSDSWNTLVRNLAPSQRKGQLILLEDNRMWFYKPGTRRPIRISPTQRLLGEASTGDVASFNFRQNYNIVSLEDTQLGKANAYLFDLEKKKDSSASYEKTKLWVQKNTFFPMQAEFYAKSGRKLKTSYYGGFKEILGVKRATEMVIVDELNSDNVTKMFITEMKPEKLPANYYQADKLPTLAF